MIRNLIDGQDVPMKLENGTLVVDVRQQRLENHLCPDCPGKLTNRGQKRGWYRCRCCDRSWRMRVDGEFDEQLPLNQSDCRHRQDPVAGPPPGSDPLH